MEDKTLERGCDIKARLSRVKTRLEKCDDISGKHEEYQRDRDIDVDILGLHIGFSRATIFGFIADERSKCINEITKLEKEFEEL